jgi:hypothetical protein
LLLASDKFECQYNINVWSHQKQGNPVWVIHCEHNTQYEEKQNKIHNTEIVNDVQQWPHHKSGESGRGTLGTQTKTNKHTQCTVRRQTNIHNTQYEEKQTYTIHSTRANKHTQYTVRRQTNKHTKHN